MRKLVISMIVVAIAVIGFGILDWSGAIKRDKFYDNKHNEHCLRGVLYYSDKQNRFFVPAYHPSGEIIRCI